MALSRIQYGLMATCLLATEALAAQSPDQGFAVGITLPMPAVEAIERGGNPLEVVGLLAVGMLVANTAKLFSAAWNACPSLPKAQFKSTADISRKLDIQERALNIREREVAVAERKIALEEKKVELGMGIKQSKPRTNARREHQAKRTRARLKQEQKDRERKSPATITSHNVFAQSLMSLKKPNASAASGVTRSNRHN